jgi:flagellin-like protein
MINKYRDKLDEEGVSPVIGVILLVAVTVAIVALAMVIVFDIGSGVSDTSDASVQMEQTDSGVQATIVRNENVDEFILRHEDGTEQRSTKSIGSFTYDNGDGEYTLIAVVGGNEEVIRSKTVVGAESGESSSADSSVLSGTVSYNSPVEGVLVESYDSEGDIVDSDLTNANGVYNVTEADELRVNNFTASYGDVDLNTVASNEGTSVPSILMNGDGSSSSPYEIRTASDLQAIQEDLSANYIVVNDIDASGTVNWNNGQGFKSIGELGNEFTGSLDGKKYDISGLNIKRQSENYVGLFGAIGWGGEVKNVGVINVNITGNNRVGGLVGDNYNGNISNSYSTGNVTGEQEVGGLVGENNNGNISNSYSTGNVTGADDVGGLVGFNDNGNISNSYSTGNVTGESDVGGLVGRNYESTVSNSYSTGNVTGESDAVGGLVGENQGTVSNSYSTGNVTGVEEVGGLVGYNNDGNISNSYSTGNVTGVEEVGGLVGDNYGTVSNSVPLTTSQMQGSSASSSMSGFDFTDTWSTVEGDYPELQWQE